VSLTEQGSTIFPVKTNTLEMSVNSEKVLGKEMGAYVYAQVLQEIIVMPDTLKNKYEINAANLSSLKLTPKDKYGNTINLHFMSP
jgi:hypothetical protein